MKKVMTLKRALLGLALVMGMGTQGWGQVVAPEFTRLTSTELANGLNDIRRGNAVWGDFNNDGLLDVLHTGLVSATNIKFSIYKQNENGSFTDISIAGVTPLQDAVATWIDYNNDGYLDIVYTGQSQIYLLKNKGDETFEEVTNSGLQGIFLDQLRNYASVIAVADYNNDGYPDIAITGKRTVDDITAGVVELYKNINGERFELQQTPLINNGKLASLHSGGILFADMNSDGWLDIVVNGTDTNGSPELKIYTNQKGDTFKDNNYARIKSTLGQVNVADLNNDGLLDLVITGTTANDAEGSIYYVIKSSGDNLVYQPAERIADAPKIRWGGVDIADIDGNGKMDIVLAGNTGATNNSPAMAICMQDNNLSFSITTPTTIPLVHQGAIVSLASMKNNGILDLLTMGYSATSNERFNIARNNQQEATNTAPTAPANLRTSYANGKITFTWDAGTDEQTPAAALRYNFYIKKGDDNVFTVIPANLSDGKLKVANLTNAINTTSFTLAMEMDDAYEWGVQTIDQGKMSSEFATAYTDFSLNDGVMILAGNWGNSDLAALDLSDEQLIAIDMTNATFSADAVLPDIANKNCLIYVAGEASYNNDWPNVVKGETASTITLIDNEVVNESTVYYPFKAIKPFTATSITYTRVYPTDGYSSLCLPFEAPVPATNVTAVEEFYATDGDVVKFKAITGNIEAYTPYIVEVTAGTIEFAGADALVAATSNANVTVDNYTFAGVFNHMAVGEVYGYVLNPIGTGFARASANSFIPSFRAYIPAEGVQGEQGAGARTLTIDRDDNATGMDKGNKSEQLTSWSEAGVLYIYAPTAQSVQISSLDGRLIATIALHAGQNTVNGLAKGIYLMNKQKAIVK